MHRVGELAERQTRGECEGDGAHVQETVKPSRRFCERDPGMLWLRNEEAHTGRRNTVLDLILAIVIAIVLIVGARWLLEALIQAIASLLSALFSAAGAMLLIGTLVWLISSIRN